MLRTGHVHFFRRWHCSYVNLLPVPKPLSLYTFDNTLTTVLSFLFTFRLFTPPKSSLMLKASCWWKKPQKNLNGLWTMEALPWCGVEDASFEVVSLVTSVKHSIRTQIWPVCCWMISLKMPSTSAKWVPLLDYDLV